MASTHSGPATPGPFPFALFFPEQLEQLHDVRLDAVRVNAALASIMELLRHCPPDTQLSAGNLEALLEPVWAGLDTLCGDLRTVDRVSSINQGD
jgi:hypothetical protein